MKITRLIFAVLFAALVFGMWLMIIYQNIQIESRRISEDRLIELLDQSQINEHRLAALTVQNTALTSKTQVILDRITSASQPAPSITPYHGPDEPLVLYEAEPAVKPAKKGRRK